MRARINPIEARPAIGPLRLGDSFRIGKQFRPTRDVEQPFSQSLKLHEVVNRLDRDASLFRDRSQAGQSQVKQELLRSAIWPLFSTRHLRGVEAGRPVLCVCKNRSTRVAGPIPPRLLWTRSRPTPRVNLFDFTSTRTQHGSALLSSPKGWARAGRRSERRSPTSL